jgi:AcrR family transcriptional regulator
VSSLRAAQKQLTRRLLLESGLDVFESKGYPSTTVDDIASGAGTTRTTFYLHFPSKAELMKSLIVELDKLLVSSDDPPLTGVVASGQRAQLRAWVERKVDQWPEIKRCASAAQAAAASDVEISIAVNRWFEGVIADIHLGLDLADRFDPASRHVRGTLAFGQLEFLSRRWFDAGWTDSLQRDSSVDLLVDSWCWLLTDRPVR